MYLSKKAQIAYLKADKAFIKALIKYANFADVFSPKLATELSVYTKINNYAIELIDNWQPSYSLTYNLGLIKLETWKTYIKNNLTNGFIKLYKSPAGALNLFDKKLNRSLKLCVNYCGLNNLITKNWYPLSLIGKSLDWLC